MDIDCGQINWRGDFDIARKLFCAICGKNADDKIALCLNRPLIRRFYSLRILRVCIKHFKAKAPATRH